MRLLLLVLVLIVAGQVSAEDVTGPVHVFDGDTVEIGGRRIHLFGIDAPELEQTCEWPAKTYPCGEVARTGLMDLLAGANVVCKTRDEAPEGGWTGTCRADGFGRAQHGPHRLGAGHSPTGHRL